MKLTYFHKIGCAGICMFFASVLLMFAILPAIIRFSVKREVALKKGWKMRDIWSKLPIPYHFHFYFFNITNPDDIDRGEKPILQEIGPFCYDDWEEKINQVDYEKSDSLSYTLRNIYIPNLERSNGLTGDEEIIVPNYFILIVINTLLIEKPSTMPFISKAMDSIFRQPNSLFIKAKVRDILFDGMMIDCNVTDFPGTTVCKEIHEKYEEFRLKKVGDNLYLMSLWGPANGTDLKKRTRIHRGLKNLEDLGKVIEYDDKTNISIWGNDYCDTFDGTDGTIFHPFFDKKGKDDIVVFNSDICRTITCRYESVKIKRSGVKLLRYTADLGIDGLNNPQHKCYCSETEGCMKKGPLNLYKCIGVPLIVTNPHFYSVDPYYSNMVEGLSPNKEQHTLTVDFDTFTGVPFEAHIRAQLNLFIQKIDKVRLMKNFPDALLPLLWFDRSLVLPDYIVKDIKSGHTMVLLARVFQYLLMLAGIGLCFFSSYKHYQLTKVAGVIDTNNRTT